jgi:benzoyl-CoA reductase/2-hydroxyglutaryl-CoA dehydratase subunit BcrC/BadD/HgdB
LIDFILAAFRQVASADELPSPETVRDAIDREDRERKLLRQLVELRTQRHAQRTRTPIEIGVLCVRLCGASDYGGLTLQKYFQTTIFSFELLTAICRLTGVFTIPEADHALP